MIVTEKDIADVLDRYPFNPRNNDSITEADRRLVGVIVEALTVLRSIVKATPENKKEVNT